MTPALAFSRVLESHFSMADFTPRSLNLILTTPQPLFQPAFPTFRSILGHVTGTAAAPFNMRSMKVDQSAQVYSPCWQRVPGIPRAPTSACITGRALSRKMSITTARLRAMQLAYRHGCCISSHRACISRWSFNHQSKLQKTRNLTCSLLRILITMNIRDLPRFDLPNQERIVAR